VCGASALPALLALPRPLVAPRPGYQLPPSEYHPCRARPARYRPA
jgi:hypothetical protein